MKRIIVFGATGTAQKRILPALRGSDIRVAAICGRREGALDALCDRYGIERRFCNEADLIAFGADCDLAIVATPPFCHADTLTALSAAGFRAPILCEKPLVSERSDLDRIAALPLGRVFVAHHLRCRAGIPYLKRILADLPYGPVENVEATWEFFADPSAKNFRWKDTPRGVGAALDVGIHCMDAIVALFGLPESVTVDAARERFSVQADHAAIRMRYPTFCAHVTASQSRPIRANSLKIRFRDAMLTDEAFFGEAGTERIVIERNGCPAEQWEADAGNLYRNEVEAALRGGRELCTASEALALLRLYFAAAG